jgi:hypothetical protein
MKQTTITFSSKNQPVLRFNGCPVRIPSKGNTVYGNGKLKEVGIWLVNTDFRFGTSVKKMSECSCIFFQ